MAVMTRAQFAKNLEEGLNAHFGDEYRSHPEEWRGVYDVESSSKATEEDVLMTGMDAAQVKDEGGGISYDRTYQGWSARYEHTTIALGFQITEEAQEDDLYMSQGPRNARALARAFQHTKEIYGADILNRAFNSSYTGGDGKELCATDHPTILGGTQSNELATPADLAESSLEEMLIQIRLAKDDRGVPIALMAKRLVLSPYDEFNARRILHSNLRPGTSANDINAIKSMGLLQQDPLVITRLADPDAWFIKTDAPHGLKHFKRVAMTRKVDIDFDTGNYRYRGRERYSFGWTDWRAIYGSLGAG